MDRRAASAFGVLWALRLISMEQHRAGRRYGALYAAHIGHRTERSCLGRMVGGAGSPIRESPDDELALELEYLAARRVLPPVSAVLIDNLVVFDRRIRKSQIAVLRRGLDILSRYFEG